MGDVVFPGGPLLPLVGVYGEIESLSNLGVLGARNEALLNLAINDIVGGAAKFEEFKPEDFVRFTDSKKFTPMSDNMYVDKPEIRKALSTSRQQNK